MHTKGSQLLLYVDLFQNHYTTNSYIRLPWERFHEEVPLNTILSLIDRWLLSPGLVAIRLPHAHCTGRHTCLPHGSGCKPASRRTNGVDSLSWVLTAEDACCKGSGRFLRRSGLVLRSAHLLRHLLAGPLV